MKVASNARRSFHPLPRIRNSQNETETPRSPLVGTASVFFSSLRPLASHPPSAFPSFEPRTSSLLILIANPRLRSDLSSNDSGSLQISNRERIAILRLAPRSYSNPKPPAPTLQNPWPPCGWRLIVTPRLEFRVTPGKQSSKRKPNRYKTQFLRAPWRTTIFRAALRSSVQPPDSSHQNLASRPQNKYASQLPMPHSSRMATLPGTTDRRIDALLTLLSENSTIVISGAKIAAEIGVSRQQVWRWIEKLRALGVRVKGHAATGYHIERVPDILAPQMLSNRLTGTAFARRIYHFFKVDSTNTVAMQLGEAGEPHGAVVLAEEQTAGRGRAGRKWISEKSAGIHCTVLLRPRIPPAHAPLLTLVAGLAARDACAEELDAAPDIRWPNDLLVGGKKFSGILTEMHAEPDRVRYAVIGIGINVNQTKMPAELAGIATSLRIETGKFHSRLQLVIRLLRYLDRYYNQFLAEGAQPILLRFAEVSTYFKGKHVKISTFSETFTGITAGLDPSGVLRVERDDGRGVEAVLSGDVSEVA